MTYPSKFLDLLLTVADGGDTAGPTAVRWAGWGTWEGGGKGKWGTNVMMSSSKLYNYYITQQYVISQARPSIPFHTTVPL